MIIISCDQSMNQPAYAVLHYNEETHYVSVRKLVSLDNKTVYKNLKKPHGQKLSEFRDLFSSEIDYWISEGVGTDNIYFVRERGFSRFATETQTIFRMVGITDLVLWDKAEKSFEQLAPKEVKRLVAGTGEAKKKDVADTQPDYVGPQEYKTDDESDAVAVGIAWILSRGYVIKKRE